MIRIRFPVVRGIGIAALAALGAAASWAGFAGAVAEVNRNRFPAVTLRYAPDNANALARRADMLYQGLGPAIAAPENAPEWNRIETLALQSLRHQPVNPLALRILGSIADLRGQHDKAVKLAKLAERMSRRELFTQLWLIENSVAENDIDAALRHYDIVLRATPQMQDILFERLSKALSEPTVRAGMVRYVTPTNPWLANFLSYVVGQDQSPLNVARTIMLADGMPDTPLLHDLAPDILRRFGERGEYRYAREYYRHVIARGDGALTAWGFTPETTDPDHGFFAWRPVAAPGLNGAFEQSQKSNDTVFRILLSDVQAGVVLRKTLMLPPGRYRIGQPRVTAASGTQAPSLSWRLACLPEHEGAPSAISGANSSMQIACDAQIMELRLNEPTGNRFADISVAPPDVTRAPASTLAS